MGGSHSRKSKHPKESENLDIKPIELRKSSKIEVGDKQDESFGAQGVTSRLKEDEQRVPDQTRATTDHDTKFQYSCQAPKNGNQKLECQPDSTQVSGNHQTSQVNPEEAFQLKDVLPLNIKAYPLTGDMAPKSTQVRPALLQVSPRSLERSRKSNPLKQEEERKTEKLKHFSTICSEILPCVYVGGKAVAANRKKLEEHKITYILNTSFTHCPNYFEEEDCFKYQSFRLYDSKEEEIMWFIYQAFDFIEEAKGKGANILVHCVEGVSRSCTICIAYLMWAKSMSYDQAFDHVREQRGVCSPNIGFVCQLLEWQKIRKQRPGYPLLFRISPHGIHDTKTFVVKLCRDARSRELIPASASSLDPRGVFIIWPPDSSRLYVWKGKDHIEPQSILIQVAIGWLQQYENAPTDVRFTLQEEETVAFWEALQGDAALAERKSTFGDLALVQMSSPRDGNESVCLGELMISEIKPILHQVRKNDDDSLGFDSLGVYDDQDLDSTGLFILLVNGNSETSYIWIGNECNIPEVASMESNDDVLNFVRQRAGVLLENITGLECVRQGQESEGFWATFEAGF